MITLYLNKTRVYLATSESIKITKCNPYFTQSGSYTLDVTLPLSIKANRDFFKNTNRLDVQKKFSKMDAELYADNRPLVLGKATVNAVKDTEVKIQLLGGNSEINFLSNNGDAYIDKILYGKVTLAEGTDDVFMGDVTDPQFETERITCEFDGTKKDYLGSISTAVFLPIYDETNSSIKNETHLRWDKTTSRSHKLYTIGDAIMPNLMYVIRKVVENFGYTISVNEYDCEPFNHIVICNARKTMKIENMLPHWTVSEFITQIQYFLNCTFVFSENDRTAKILSNINYFKDNTTNIEAVDSFDSDVSDPDNTDDKSLGSSNVAYDVSDSDTHRYDHLSDDILDGYTHKTYDSLTTLMNAAEALEETERKKYLYECPSGKYVYAEIDVLNDDGTTASSSWAMKQVDQFGRIVRNTEDDDDLISIKVCPVGITEDEKLGIYEIYSLTGSTNHGTVWHKTADKYTTMPSMANPIGDSSALLNNLCIWDGITGSEDVNSEETAEDRIQVMYVSDKVQYFKGTLETGEAAQAPYPIPFTDYADKNMFSNDREKWSMALTKSAADKYIGKKHANGYQINTQTKLQIDFISNSIPDVDSIFYINHKRYCCEKLEIKIKDTGLNNLITGYFYEMI